MLWTTHIQWRIPLALKWIVSRSWTNYDLWLVDFIRHASFPGIQKVPEINVIVWVHPVARHRQIQLRTCKTKRFSRTLPCKRLRYPQFTLYIWSLFCDNWYRNIKQSKRALGKASPEVIWYLVFVSTGKATFDDSCTWASLCKQPEAEWLWNDEVPYGTLYFILTYTWYFLTQNFYLSSSLSIHDARLV